WNPPRMRYPDGYGEHEPARVRPDEDGRGAGTRPSAANGSRIHRAEGREETRGGREFRRPVAGEIGAEEKDGHENCLAREEELKIKTFNRRKQGNKGWIRKPFVFFVTFCVHFPARTE